MSYIRLAEVGQIYFLTAFALTSVLTNISMPMDYADCPGMKDSRPFNVAKPVGKNQKHQYILFL